MNQYIVHTSSPNATTKWVDASSYKIDANGLSFYVVRKVYNSVYYGDDNIEKLFVGTFLKCFYPTGSYIYFEDTGIPDDESLTPQDAPLLENEAVGYFSSKETL